jgi:hypothetical protein
LAVCGEAGAANALAPVIDRLRAENAATVMALGCRQAIAVWRQRGLAFEASDDQLPMEAVKYLFQSLHPSLLLAGTSVGRPIGPVELEKKCIAVARQRDVPSIAVLDYWNNYMRRFYSSDGQPIYLPDRIAVMDVHAYDEMVAVGFDPTRIVITGQPHLESLLNGMRTGFTVHDKEGIRTRLGARPGQIVMAFASQPISDLYGKDGTASDFPGYLETEVVSGVIAGLDQIAARHAVDILLVIRPHPRESLENYVTLRTQRIQIKVSKEEDPHQLVMSVDVVMGMATMLLVEACYLGCPVISIQPGLKLQDTLVTNRTGLSLPVYRWAEFEPIVERVLFDVDFQNRLRQRPIELNPPGTAAQMITNMALEMSHTLMIGG